MKPQASTASAVCAALSTSPFHHSAVRFDVTVVLSNIHQAAGGPGERNFARSL
jgi:hypothetical protein